MLTYSLGPDGDDDDGRALSGEAFFLDSDGDMILDYPDEDEDSPADVEDADDE